MNRAGIIYLALVLAWAAAGYLVITSGQWYPPTLDGRALLFFLLTAALFWASVKLDTPRK